MNSFEYLVFPSSVGISSHPSDPDSLSFHLAPVIDKGKVLTVTSLCALGSMINHSCEPNMIVRVSFSRQLQWIAARDVAEGEELLTSYLGDTEASTEHRKQELLNSYEFSCACPKCTPLPA